MRIGIDARFIKRPGGIGRYTDELLKALRARKSPHEFVALAPDVPWYTVAEQLKMPGIIDRERFDLFHFPHWNVPLRVKTPFVLTIHDLLILDHPTARATTLGPVRYAIKKFGHRHVLASAIRRARAIIVPSAFVRHDLTRRFPGADNKTFIIPEGVQHESRIIKHETSDNIPRILYVGNAYPHKNLIRLLRAFAFVRVAIPTAELTIAGYDDYFFKKIKMDAKKIAMGVRFVGSPTDDDLEKLYASTTIFVMPSLTEGFGLPPLEAMARGVAVASSRGGSLPEVLGDAAAYFDPLDEQKMADAMIELLRNDELRHALAECGRARSALYSWQTTADRTLEIYENALAKTSAV